MKSIPFLLFLSLTISNGFAQKNTLSCGTTASNTIGSISFSIGQIDYASTSSITSKITQGLQQPYELFSITSLNEFFDNEIKISPNPTIGNIKIETNNSQDNQIKLFTINGDIIFTKKIIDGEYIPLDQLPSGIYFLNCINPLNNKVSNFKIIKK